MKLGFRAVAVGLLLALAWAGPLAPLAAAQQPAAPPPAQSAPPATPPQMFQEDVKPLPPRTGTDIYDVGATVATVVSFPAKIALCGLGVALGMIAFGSTFSARPDAAAGIIDEGCGGKAQWIIRGRDIRPRPSVSKAFDWENHRFEWEK